MSSNKPNPLAAQPGTKGIDPRGPRFGATITLITLTVELIFLLSNPEALSSSNTLAQNFAAPAGILLTYITVIFAIGAFAGIGKHPYGAIFKALVRPRLSAPTELEDPKPPTFAQLIGFIITLAGLVFAVLGITTGAIIAVAFAFVAAFLNSVFGYCLGCQIYVLLVRAGIVGRGSASA
ncbi:hypothetical protein M2114_001037 [Aurantimicrobium minutum]|uniref:DUF4395 domain-containing protein n=1 Tax=Aurantimicrobium minutum TaxID=708131 RepID=UPI0024762BD4|nr:DUF4395 domain-containing protein [Aurantimicrobium minutum]MDH6424920.1 hypothetical protein [Aurantimicrobium minutum]